MDLDDILTQIAADLMDSDNAVWSQTELTIQVRQALARYNRADPRRIAVTIESIEDQRDYDLADEDPPPTRILDVWYPHNPDHPLWPPPRCPFITTSATTIYLTTTAKITGNATDQIRVLYQTTHTIDGLDAATATTLSPEGEQIICLLASAGAGMMRAQYATGRVTVHAWTPRQLLEWATTRQQEALDLLRAISHANTQAASGIETWNARI